MSVKFVTNKATVEEIQDLKKVGDNNTPLLEYILSVPNFKKTDDGWEHTGDDYFQGQAWGDKATEFMMEVSEGDELSLSGKWVDKNDGYLKADAYLQERNFEYKGKEYYKSVVSIININKKEKQDD